MQSAAALLAIDGEVVAPRLYAVGIDFLTEKLSEQALLQKVAAADSPAAVRFARLLLLIARPPAVFTADTMLSIHKTLYADQRSDCGKLRKTALEIGGNSCTDARYLKGSLKAILGRMQALPAAPECAKADFAASLAHYARELSILSPFAYGNGIVRRAFLLLLCMRRGFDLNFSAVGRKEFAAAEAAALAADDAHPLFTLFITALSYTERTEGAYVTVTAQTAATRAGKRTIAKPSTAKTTAIKQKEEPAESSPPKKRAKFGGKKNIANTTTPATSAVKQDIPNPVPSIVSEEEYAPERLWQKIDALQATVDSLTEKLDALIACLPNKNPPA